ncbi:MAG TPA: hypothetical protein VH593_08130 [Ktedonobacteraceae bacterium]
MVRFIISSLGLGILLVGCAPGGGTTSSPTPASTAGGRLVSISTDKATYAPDGTITVTVHNTLATPIYAMDTLASCSILSLQFQVNGAWQASQVAQCPQKRPARPVKIDAGATYTAMITAGYPGLQQLPFPTGSYQLALVYATSPDTLPSTENGTRITSSIFQVQ